MNRKKYRIKSLYDNILDYRGECNVILINHSKVVQMIKKGDRIAQFVFNQYLSPRFDPVQSKEDLSKTSRGSGGFGSTGS